MDAVPFNKVLFPLTHVAVIFYAFPKTKTFFLTGHPFAFIDLSVRPVISSFAVRVVVHEAATVVVPVLVPLVAVAVALVCVPLAFVNAPAVVHLHAKAFSLLCALGNLAFVDGVLVALDAKIRLRRQLLEVKQVGRHVVLTCHRAQFWVDLKRSLVQLGRWLF